MRNICDGFIYYLTIFNSDYFLTMISSQTKDENHFNSSEIFSWKRRASKYILKLNVLNPIYERE